MRYQIRSKGGGELQVRDGTEVIRLLRQKFLEPEDEIRREGQEKWRKIGDIPEYASMLRAEKHDVRRFQRVLLVTALLACMIMIAAVLARL